MFLIGKSNDSVTWKPDFETHGNNWSQHFALLGKSVKGKFKGIKLKQTQMIYNPYNSVPCIDTSLFDDIDSVLSKDNIEKYWKLLESSKSVSMLKFSIDTDNVISNSKRTVCISVHSNTNETKLSTFLIKKDAYGKDINWKENYFSLLAMINKQTGTKLEDIGENDEIAYDKLSYRIFKLENCNSVLTKMKEEMKKDDNFLTQLYKYRDLFELGDEIDDDELFEDCYESNDDRLCVFWIEKKKCLQVSENRSKKIFFWTPSKLDLKSIDWEFEFKQLKKEICNHFDLQNNGKLSLRRMDKKEADYWDNYGHLEDYWGV